MAPAGANYRLILTDTHGGRWITNYNTLTLNGTVKATNGQAFDGATLLGSVAAMCMRALVLYDGGARQRQPTASQ